MYSDVKGQVKTIKAQVEAVLASNVAARSSDKVLLVEVLKRYYGVVHIEDILRDDVPTIESIRRVRQKLQEAGKFTAKAEVQAARNELQEDYRNIMKGEF